ncbi:MAG: ribulose-phosphate 3-epimerase [Armatimonadetes bacterium]|nr:ribulose-phosphate 3-epimerase [Armatimonadota bacterium]
MKCEIAPSVLSFPHGEIQPRVAELVAAGASLIHLDVMDGQFVPPITFGDGLAASLRSIPGIRLEAHLMTVTPDRHFEAFVKSGCFRVIFHAEATAHSHRLIQTLHGMGVQAGIAINPGTSVAAVREVLHLADHCLIMTVNPGWGGQAMIREALDKVRKVRAMRPDIEIQVDGGIDATTLPLAREAGANLFVVGSHLLAYNSLAEAAQTLNKLCQ